MIRVPLLAALAVCAALASSSLLLDHGVHLGVGPAALEAVGRVYFGLLLGAPFVVYPLAWWSGLAFRWRLALSLLPGFLWWTTEIALRLADHSLAEALWLVSSPINLAHLYVALLAVAIADLGCRLAARWLSRAVPHRSRRTWLAAAAALLAGPVLLAGSIPPFLFGYRAIFQRDLLPAARTLPGALPESELPAPPRSAARPNVVVILSDDHRHDFAGHAGHPFVLTPSLDRLAADGVRFERAYVSSSLCSPSRASLLTGTTPYRHGVWNNFTAWSDENRTFFEYLSRAGYETAFIGKWHMPGGLPRLRGVDHFVTFTNLGGQGTYEWCPLVVDGREEPSRTRYVATELTDRALAWLESRRDGPFALLLSHKSVHSDFTPDLPDRSRYESAPVALPPGSHPWSHLVDAQYTHLAFRPLPTLVRRYAETVTSMDREIGRVLAYLDEHGLRQSTLVMYTSDNGYLWGEHGLVDKRSAFEESIRVPLLVRPPAGGFVPGSRREQLVTNVDLAPTLLELAGFERPAHMQGRSLLPVLRDPAAAHRDEILYRYYFEPPYPTPTVRALVTERQKLIEVDGRPPMLFDLRADPGEQRDRLGDPGDAEAPGLARFLAERMRALEREQSGSQ